MNTFSRITCDRHTVAWSDWTCVDRLLTFIYRNHRISHYSPSRGRYDNPRNRMKDNISPSLKANSARLYNLRKIHRMHNGSRYYDSYRDYHRHSNTLIFLTFSWILVLLCGMSNISQASCDACSHTLFLDIRIPDDRSLYDGSKLYNRS